MSTLKLNVKKHRDLIPTRLHFSFNFDSARSNSDFVTTHHADADETEDDRSSISTEASSYVPLKTATSSKTLFISNISFGKPASEVEKYGTYLAGDRPKTVQKSKTHDDVWVLEFDNPLGKLSQNLNLSPTTL